MAFSQLVVFGKNTLTFRLTFVKCSFLSAAILPFTTYVIGFNVGFFLESSVPK